MLIQFVEWSGNGQECSIHPLLHETEAWEGQCLRCRAMGSTGVRDSINSAFTATTVKEKTVLTQC